VGRYVVAFMAVCGQLSATHCNCVCYMRSKMSERMDCPGLLSKMAVGGGGNQQAESQPAAAESTRIFTCQQQQQQHPSKILAELLAPLSLIPAL